MSQTDKSTGAKAKAEARFKRGASLEATANQGRLAVEAEKIAEAEKTVRLRKLRLAKEEADRAYAAANPPVKVKKRK